METVFWFGAPNAKRGDGGVNSECCDFAPNTQSFWNIVKCWLLIESILIDDSFWKFWIEPGRKLSCFVQNFRRNQQQRNKLWTHGVLWYFSLQQIHTLSILFWARVYVLSLVNICDYWISITISKHPRLLSVSFGMLYNLCKPKPRPTKLTI